MGSYRSLVADISHAQEVPELAATPTGHCIHDLKNLGAKLTGAAVDKPRMEGLGVDAFRRIFVKSAQQLRCPFCLLRAGHEIREEAAFQVGTRLKEDGGKLG